MSFEKFTDVQLIVYDFDGVMTDNRAFLFADGSEAVKIHRGDGLAVSRIRKRGIAQLILSSEKNEIVVVRGKKLQIPVLFGIDDKFSSLKKYCLEKNLDMSKVAFVGNDLNDLECMQNARWAIAPSDAYPQVKSIAHYVTNAVGGAGVIRELADSLLGLQN